MRLIDPMSRLLGWRALRMAIGILVLIQAVFQAYAFTSLMRRVVSNGGSMLDLLPLMVLRMPQVVDFALPLALLLGIYFAVTGSREDNELVVCAAAGVPWTRIVGFALTAGGIGLVTSLAFTGYITPTAAQVFRLAMYELGSRHVIEQITEPDQREAVRTLSGRTYIMSPRPGTDAVRGNLFVFHPDTGEGWRVSHANDWTVRGPNDQGGYSVELRSFREYYGSSDGAAAEANRVSTPLGPGFPLSNLRVDSVTLDFRMEQVVEEVNLNRRRSEMRLRDLIAPRNGNGDWTPPRRLGEILARALLCPIAALIAVVGAGFAATRAGRLTALPASVVGVLGADIVLRAILGDAAAAGEAMLIATTAGAAAIGIGLPLIALARRGEALITPGRHSA